MFALSASPGAQKARAGSYWHPALAVPWVMPRTSRLGNYLPWPVCASEKKQSEGLRPLESFLSESYVPLIQISWKVNNW